MIEGPKERSTFNGELHLVLRLVPNVKKRVTHPFGCRLKPARSKAIDQHDEVFREREQNIAHGSAFRIKFGGNQGCKGSF